MKRRTAAPEKEASADVAHLEVAERADKRRGDEAVENSEKKRLTRSASE
jgi:hypothetical protein